MLDFISPSELSALFSVIVIDLVLAGDNALVVGMAAAGLPREQRFKVIVIGIAAATVLRIVFALSVTYLLAIIGLLLAGGILLLWVAWKLWREIEDERRRRALEPAKAASAGDTGEATVDAAPEPKTFRAAVTQIVIADVTMSLDNVLGVAGAPVTDITAGILGERGRAFGRIFVADGTFDLVSAARAQFVRRSETEGPIDRVTVRSARPMSVTDIDGLRERMQRPGRHMIFHEELDDTLKGGFVLRHGDWRRDFSVAARLEALKLALR